VRAMIASASGLAAVLFLFGAVPAAAQGTEFRRPLAGDAALRKHFVSVDIGVLQGGLGYARRIGRGPFAVGAGVWAAWDPWTTVEQSVFYPMGGELFVRYHPSELAHLEIGPSLLRYRWADDCSECAGTFYGARASVMFGKGAFWVGPTARFGVLTGAPTGDETGLLWGVQGRLLFSWGE